MIFQKKHKLKDLYVARLGRVTKETYIPGKRFLDDTVNYTTEFDGPIGIFTIKGNTATRVSSGVQYYYYDGTKFPKKNEWYVRSVTPISHLFNFNPEVTSISINNIRELERILKEDFENKKEQSAD